MQVSARRCRNFSSHAVDRLTPGEDGKRKVFHSTAIDKITEFIGTFKDRNVFEDAELAEVVKKVKMLNDGITVSDLRTDEAIRGAYRAAAEKLKGQMDLLVEDAPERDFGD